ncbi:12-oxophytodienoate reductase [Sphingobium cloacae]|uniref:12-oxophytodienoate reductase n=2 Tax=Sphingobium cloacae TaxID=120107 RepID=A0A1E1F6X5_9SPHN|nr:12-oxophytodienoate reductase [Sphingobium cloacae]
MTRYYAPEGVPKPEVAAYYGRRSRGGAGLIITEGTFLDRKLARNNERIPWFHGERLQPWRRIVETVHAGGGAIALQLWHVGGVRDFNFPSCLIPRFDGAILSLEWKEALWDRYVTGAPRPRTPSEQQYSDRKLRSRR